MSHDSTSTIEPPSSRVSAVGVVLNENETDVLSLGPKFALAPRVDERLKKEVQINLAQTAYRLRWKTLFSNEIDETCPTSFEFIKSKNVPFQRPFAGAPPTTNIAMEHHLRQLCYIINTRLEQSKVPSNLKAKQREGLKSLIARKEELHFSRSDKGGEFVIMSSGVQQQITQKHLSDMTSEGAYTYVAPTTTRQNRIQPIANPSEVSYSRLINRVTERLETESNVLWSEISRMCNYDSKTVDLFKSHNTQLPTIYLIQKTHKFDCNVLVSDVDIISNCKIRPIVSCINSPSEKLAWIVKSILSPLLNHVPSHLSNIHTHLEELQNMSHQQLAGLSFFTADVTALYTNINISGCIQDLITLTEEHWEDLDTWGLSLTHIHMILDFVFTNSYFTYNSKLYLQKIGLFMGCQPSPIGAIVRVYMFERRSIYTDLHVSFYRRYVDDAGSLANSKEEALRIVESISNEDPDQLLKWEVDYPENSQEFTPFLDTQIRIDEQGQLHHKFYRKKQKKKITLHANSHHDEGTKVATIKNFYKTAAHCSSTPEYKEESMKIVDNLLVNNGYQDPRRINQTGRLHPIAPTTRHNPSSSHIEDTNHVTCTLPFINEPFSKEVTQFAHSHNLPVKFIFTPGKKLADILCSSRPHDKPHCTIPNCIICPLITTNHDCKPKCVIYKVTCKLCQELYIGETSRTAHDRFSEHRRAANRPLTYPDNALAAHYLEFHNNLDPDISFDILEINLYNTIKRKVTEAYYINLFKPSINNKEECEKLKGFLLQHIQRQI